MAMNRNHLLLAVTIALVSSPAAAEHEPSHRTVGSYSIYAGVVSAGVMAFRQDHGELRMHGGVPAGLDQHHLLVGLFEQKSGARVTDAEISVRFTGPRGTEEKELLHVPLGGEIAYGNFFRMRPDERYRIDLNIRRAGAAGTVEAAFEYRHRL